MVTAKGFWCQAANRFLRWKVRKDMTEGDRTERLSADEPDDGPGGDIARARLALEPVRRSLKEAGFYSYEMVDDQQRWTVAADAEEGRVDVRVGADGYNVVLWTSSPGLYADEENAFRRRAQERLVRMTLPNLVQGFLSPHQHAMWDESDAGVAVTLTYELPFARAADIGQFVRESFPELDELLTFVETRVGG